LPAAGSVVPFFDRDRSQIRVSRGLAGGSRRCQRVLKIRNVVCEDSGDVLHKRCLGRASGVRRRFPVCGGRGSVLPPVSYSLRESPEEATLSGETRVCYVHDGAVYPDFLIPEWLLGVVELISSIHII